LETIERLSQECRRDRISANWRAIKEQSEGWLLNTRQSCNELLFEGCLAI
jgi:hypothetical protein